MNERNHLINQFIKNNYGKQSNEELQRMIEREFGELIQLPTLRQRYKRMKDKPSKPKKESDFVKEQPRQEYERFLPNGEKELLKVIFLTPAQKESPEAVLRVLGYDPRTWQMQDLIINTWQQNSTEKGITDLYQVKVRLKPAVQLLTTEDQIRLFEEKVKSIKLKPFKIEKKYYNDFNNNLVMEIPADELHIGKSYLEDETAEERFYKKVQEIINTQSVYKASTAFVGFGNDVFNSEANGMTTAGTPQSNNMSYEEMFDTVCDLYLNMFNELKKHFKKIDVQLVRSNHGYNLDFAAYRLLSIAFKDDPTFNFDKGYNDTQCYQFGKCVIFNNHGDFGNGQPLQRYLKSLVNEFSDVFGKSLYRVARLYHFHSVYALDDEFGIEMTRGTASTGLDKWHYKNRYLARQRYNYYLWDKNEGEIARFYVNYETVYDKKKVLKR